MHTEEIDFTLRVYVEPPELLDEEAIPTRPFQKEVMKEIVDKESRRVELMELAHRRRTWARRLLIRFGFGLPEHRSLRLSSD
jgi:hypothetical protein